MENSLIGGLYLIVLFGFSFAAVYITKIVYVLLSEINISRHAKHRAPMPEREKQTPQKVYYLVERKKVPVKRRTVSPPKQIYFSENTEN